MVKSCIASVIVARCDLIVKYYFTNKVKKARFARKLLIYIWFMWFMIC